MEYDLGPKAKYSVNSPGLVQFMNDCAEYIASLSEFDEYCIWRYTIGSASINKYLIFHKENNKELLDDNSIFWVYLFFKYWNSNGVREQLPPEFARFDLLFREPNRFASMEMGQRKSQIADIIIRSYIKRLQRIILGGPRLRSDITVYKVSGIYPGLPSTDPLSFKPTVVKQDPFNSTTINRAMNFEMFISPTSPSAIFEILIKKGTKGVLYVPTDMHAYGNIEREILFPFGCSFAIHGIKTDYLTFVDPATVNLETIQDKRRIKVGIVYAMNEFQPCKSVDGSCYIQSKEFNVFEADYVPPKL